jgi:hypothetical protein
LLTTLLGLLAALWIFLAASAARGMWRISHLAGVDPIAEKELPSVSILFSARDEAEKMPAALRSMLVQNYPRYEVIAVDDRSSDPTGEILREFARSCKHLKVIHVEELQTGWLGKPHGLYKAFEQSTGEWLVFTDADVRFEPDLLRRAVSLALERGWDHLTLFPEMEMEGFWEKTVLTTFFALGILLYRPWDVPNPRSRVYSGVGAFQLLRRTVYQEIGTHRRLALEVVDDMKLGRLVKDAGYVSGVAMAQGFLRLRWHAGLANIIRGTEKNFFAVSGFRPAVTLAQILALFLLSVLPFFALPFITGWARAFAAAAAVSAVLIHATGAASNRTSPLYGLTHPIGVMLFCFMLARSTFLTLRQGGIYWRDTFYPLEELRRGVI